MEATVDGAVLDKVVLDRGKGLASLQQKRSSVLGYT